MKSIADKVDKFVKKYDSSTDSLHFKMIEQIRKYDEKLLKRLLRKKGGNISVKRSLTDMLPGTTLVKNLKNEEYLDLLLDGASGLEERFAQIDSRVFLSEFSEMKSQNKKTPADARKLIKEKHFLEMTAKMFLATAS